LVCAELKKYWLCWYNFWGASKPFIETCNFLRSHAIRHDQQSKDKAARQIHNTSQSFIGTKKDKVKWVLALINEMQIQGSCESKEEADIMSPSKTAMVCKLVRIPPEIWMTLSLGAKIWFFNKRKHQQQEDDKVKRSMLLINKESMKVLDRDGDNSGIPNQYARVKVASKGEEEVQEEADQNQNNCQKLTHIHISQISWLYANWGHDHCRYDHGVNHKSKNRFPNYGGQKGVMHKVKSKFNFGKKIPTGEHYLKR
jgi:hypothetical protein